MCFSDNLCNTVDSKYENADAISFSSVHKILKTARSRQQEFFHSDVICIYMIRGMLLNLILCYSCRCSAIRLTMFYMKYSVHRPLEFTGQRIFNPIQSKAWIYRNLLDFKHSKFLFVPFLQCSCIYFCFLSSISSNSPTKPKVTW